MKEDKYLFWIRCVPKFVFSNLALCHTCINIVEINWYKSRHISQHYNAFSTFFFKFEFDVYLMRLHLIFHSWTVSNGMKFYGGCLEIRKENSCKIAISVVYTYQIRRNNVHCKYCEQILLKQTLNCNPFSIIKYIVL